MVVSAAILVFALRVDMSKDYKAALDELRAVKELDITKWVTFVHDRYSDVEIQNDKFVREIVRQAGLPLQGDPPLNEPVFGDGIQAGTLLQFDAFLSANQKIGILKLVGDKQTAAEQLKHGVAQRNSHPVVSGMWLSGFPGGYGQEMMDWRNPPLTPTITLNFNINDQPQTAPNQPVWTVVSFKIVSEQGHFALEWLRKDIFGRNLVDSKTGEVLPHLKVFWEKVNGLTPEAATLYLQGQLEETTRGTVSFFGIPVETRLAISASPVICFAILLFLCLHLRHVRTLTDDIQETASFPFALLFKGALGALAVTYVTVFILPVFANVELLRRFGDCTQLSTKVGAVFTVLTGAIAIWTVVEIHRLRNRLFGPTEPSPQSSE
jgi:hypothetical protein